MNCVQVPLWQAMLGCVVACAVIVLWDHYQQPRKRTTRCQSPRWLCVHCGVMITDLKSARVHSGGWGTSQPSCTLPD